MKIVSTGRPSGVRTALPSPPPREVPLDQVVVEPALKPEPDRPYPVKLDNGRTIEVKFGPDLCQRIREWDMAVYLTRGQLQAPDGQLYRLDSQDLAAQLPAYSYAMFPGNSEITARPTSGVRLDLSPDGRLSSQLGVGGLLSDTQVLRADRDQVVEQLVDRVACPKLPGPIDTASWVRLRLGRGVSLHAPSLVAAQPLLKQWNGMLKEREALPREQLSWQLAHRVVESGQDPAAPDSAMRKLLGPEFAQASLEEMALEFQRRLSRGRDLELVVLPRDKDVADYLGYDPLPPATSPSSRRAGVASRGEGPRVLYVGEELLQGDGLLVAQHELLHVFEERYANDQELDRIEADFQRAHQNQGPFACLYGSQRREFLTTLGEEYYGISGSEGRDWVRQHHPGVYQILTQISPH